MPGTGEPMASARRLAALEKQRQALELRKAGASYEKIADQLGYASKSGAYKAVTSALQKTLREPAEELRTLEVERLDRMQLALWKRALDGDLKAAQRVLDILGERCKLLGLYAPQKIAPTTPDGQALPLGIRFVDSLTEPPHEPAADPHGPGSAPGDSPTSGPAPGDG